MITKIKTAMMNAMKEKDTIKKDVLKMVINKANMIAKDAKVEVPTDEMVMDAIKKEIKQLQDTIDVLQQNNKTETLLYTESVTKQEILKEYMPAQLDKETLKVEIERMIAESGVDTKNKAAVMKLVMPAFKSRANGKLINQVVCEILK